MALFDSIISEVASKFGLGDKAGPLVSALFSYIQGEGIGGFLDKFKTAGLGNLVSSWVSTGANEPMTESQVDKVLGGDVISTIASKAGLSAGAAKPALAFMLPSLIDKLTPSGVLPTSLPSIGSLLTGGLGMLTGAAGAVTGAASDVAGAAKGAVTGAAGMATDAAGAALGAASNVAGAAKGAVRGAAGAALGAGGAALGAGSKMASSAMDAAGDAASAGGSGLLKLLPLLLLALLAFLGYQYCNRPPETPAVAVATPTPMPKINSSLSMIYGENGRVKITGVVPDQATKDAILAEAKATYGDKFDADITVNANAQKAGWFASLKDIFKNFNIPGAELSFDGDALKVAGVAAAASLVDKFKGLFPSFNISSAFLNIADAAKAANEKAMAALASLSGSASAEDLVKALNLQIVNFASGKADLPKENQDILKKAADAIKAMPPATKIEVGGHTDNKGAAASNLKLSEGRAMAVQKFLVGLGVKADALTAKGYGPDKPVATNDTEAGRFSNRRIEFALSK